jgi:hypothetical protein
VVLRFHVNHLPGRLERDEADGDALKEQILVAAAPLLPQIAILPRMKGISVFIAIAIIDISRFRNAKAFTSYLRSAPHGANSNTSKSSRGTNKKERKLSAALISQPLNHVLASCPKLQRWYERLTEFKKTGLVRTGLRRRVFAEIFQMLNKQEYHYGRDPAKHTAKMEQYNKFLKKHSQEALFKKTS